ncbi:MAG TPA: cobalamin-binding protein [Hyphomicrobiaceae bacterium]|jgi:iron complex transport system substrate-binding protein|nr:cobalamin-binding protein [Hyphomicrobiaceae bacterium]
MTSEETAMPPLRVVSLIASATEIVCALGRGDWLVGRSHECDYPSAVACLPALTAPKFKVEGSSAEIDRRVRKIVRDGLSVYRVDAEALSALRPDLIVTQDHCDVCAVSLRDVEEAVCRWTDRRVEILSLRPDCLADAYADIRRVAGALAAEPQGAGLVAGMERRLRALAAAPARRRRPRVAFIEWVEPLMAGGNWMPELIEAAGGHNLFGVAGKPSGWMSWDALAAADPEVIIVAPCGFGLQRCLAELPLLQAKPGWTKIDAVRNGRVFFADGNAYFNRPGPRLADSGEILAQVLHGEPASPNHEAVAWVRHTPQTPAGS